MILSPQRTRSTCIDFAPPARNEKTTSRIQELLETKALDIRDVVFSWRGPLAAHEVDALQHRVF
jgi:hypothetical protein